MEKKSKILIISLILAFGMTTAILVSVFAKSPEDLIGMAYSSLNEKVGDCQSIFTNDYDGDGNDEAFVLAGKITNSYFDDYGRLYYINSKGGCFLVNDELAGNVDECKIVKADNRCFFVFELSYGGSGSWSKVFGVEASDWYLLNMDGGVSGFYQKDNRYFSYESDFSKGYHDYVEREMYYYDYLMDFSFCAKDDIETITLDDELSLSVIELNKGDYSYRGVIEAKKGNKLIWKYTTEEIIRTELEAISSDYVIDSGNAYMVINNNLTCFDMLTGNTKWTVPNAGASNSIVCDKYGNIYVSGFYGPNLMVTDKMGTVLYYDDNAEWGWVYDLYISGNSLNISYALEDEEGEFEKTFDIMRFAPISVKLNGQNISFDQSPIIKDGRTLVPLRAIFEELGATVDWNGNTQTVTAKKDSTTIRISIGDNKLYVNDNMTILDVPAQIVNDRTLVPVRAVSEAFGCNVDWNSTTREVIITK